MKTEKERERQREKEKEGQRGPGRERKGKLWKERIRAESFQIVVVRCDLLTMRLSCLFQVIKLILCVKILGFCGILVRD